MRSKMSCMWLIFILTGFSYGGKWGPIMSQGVSIDGGYIGYTAGVKVVYAWKYDHKGLLRSLDGGKSWEFIVPSHWSDSLKILTLSPDDPNTVVATFSDSGLMRSENGGKDWVSVPLPFIEKEGAYQFGSGGNGAFIYAIFTENNSDVLRLAKSSDICKTWDIDPMDTITGVYETANSVHTKMRVNDDGSVFIISAEIDPKGPPSYRISFRNVKTSGFTHRYSELLKTVTDFSLFELNQITDKSLLQISFFSTRKVWISADSGSTWSELKSTPITGPIFQSIVSPTNTDVVLQRSGVSTALLTGDNGESWQTLQKAKKFYMGSQLYKVFDVCFNPWNSEESVVFTTEGIFLKNVNDPNSSSVNIASSAGYGSCSFLAASDSTIVFLDNLFRVIISNDAGKTNTVQNFPDTACIWPRAVTVDKYDNGDVVTIIGAGG